MVIMTSGVKFAAALTHR